MRDETIAFIDRIGSDITVESDRTYTVGSKPHACYICASDYIVKRIEIGRMSDTDRRDYIEYRLTSYLPDSSDNILYSFLGADNNESGNRSLLLTRKSVICEYRQVFPKAKLVSLVYGFKDASESFMRIVIHDHWLEWAESNSHIWGIVQTVKLAQQEKKLVLKEIIAKSSFACIQIICDDHRKTELKAYSQELSGIRTIDISIISFTEALQAKSIGLFQAEDGIKKRLSIAVGICLFSVGITVFNLGMVNIRFQSQEANNQYTAELQRLKKIRLENQALQSEFEKLQKDQNSSNSSHSSPYKTLATISSAPSSRLKIKTFSYQGGRFLIEADAATALEYTAKLSQAPGIKNLRLSNVQPKDGFEHFFLEGEYNEPQ